MNLSTGYVIDIKYAQRMKSGQRVYGDSFLCKKIREENRWIAVLSDGLGSGIKANVLSTLTATMAMKFTAGFRDIKKSAEIIMKTLPVCSERKISYATFTIIDIDDTGVVRSINYDNPEPILLRNGKKREISQEFMTGTVKGRSYRLGFSRFQLIQNDRLLLTSDGVTQAGMGSEAFPLGWGTGSVAVFAESHIAMNDDVTAKCLSELIVNKGCQIDNYSVHDDTTCGIIHCREPRELLVVSGPPVDKNRDSALAALVSSFCGNKIICGGTTAKIVARELEKPVKFLPDPHYSPLPPRSVIDGIDLVTEGIITLHAVESLLAAGRPSDPAQGNPADAIVEMMLESDRIHFVLGTKINEAWQDPSLPDDFGLRRTIIAKIRHLLDTTYQKETKVTVW